MVRLIGFYLLIFASLWVLRHIPFLGGMFGGMLGFWAMVIVASAAIANVSSALVRRRRLASRIADLGNTDTPHNQGKLGALLLSSGQAKRAIEPLKRAAAGEPESSEWSYRLGCALLATGRAQEALAALRETADRNAEYAYGAVQLRLAEAQHAVGEFEAEVRTLQSYEDVHSANPESAYRMGLALRRLGRGAEARACFARVGTLYAHTPRFRRRHQRAWMWRSLVSRVV
jgi:tetratricopeptide (TPR) repeat protein